MTAAVSYLRLLSALVTRAPGPAEATARARLLLEALVTAITKEAGAIVGDGGAGVTVRSAGSDSVVLCMQTLRFLLGWTEQSGGTGSGDPSSSSSSSSGRSAQRLAHVPSVAAAATATARGGETPICLHGLRTRRSTEAAAGGSSGRSSSTPCFVCPLVGKTRRCEFVQVIPPVREKSSGGQRGRERERERGTIHLVCCDDGVAGLTGDE